MRRRPRRAAVRAGRRDHRQPVRRPRRGCGSSPSRWPTWTLRCATAVASWSYAAESSPTRSAACRRGRARPACTCRSDAMRYARRRQARLAEALAAQRCSLHTPRRGHDRGGAGQRAPSGQRPFRCVHAVLPALVGQPRCVASSPQPDRVRAAREDLAVPAARRRPTAGRRRIGGQGTGRRGGTGRQLRGYADQHDDLAGDRTSRLSPYLHFGCVSPLELVTKAGSRDEGAEAFVRQLAWRDFHHQVLAARPDAAHRRLPHQGRPLARRRPGADRVAAGQDRHSDRGRRHAAACRRALDAQPRPADHRQFPRPRRCTWTGGRAPRTSTTTCWTATSPTTA